MASLLRKTVASLCITTLSGCSWFGYIKLEQELSGYTYVPVEAIRIDGFEPCECAQPAAQPGGKTAAEIAAERNKEVLKYLPDNALRISVQEIKANGEIKFGAVGATAKGSRYLVTFDHIISDSSSFDIWIAKTAIDWSTGIRQPIPIRDRLNSGTHIIGTEQYHFRAESPDNQTPPSDVEIKQIFYPWKLKKMFAWLDKEQFDHNLAEAGELKLTYEKLSIPMYIGVGLRVEAEIVSAEGGLNISGLQSLSGSQFSGNLVTKTLGINGEGVQAAIPSDSELNRTSIQNSIIATAKIKTLLYAGGDTALSLTPRVVGIYLPVPADLKLINGIIGKLSGADIIWEEGGKKGVKVALK
jgi:hypothetical protein